MRSNLCRLGVCWRGKDSLAARPMHCMYEIGAFSEPLDRNRDRAALANHYASAVRSAICFHGLIFASVFESATFVIPVS